MAVVLGLPGHFPFEVPDSEQTALDYYRGEGARVVSGGLDGLSDEDRAVFVPLGGQQGETDGAPQVDTVVVGGQGPDAGPLGQPQPADPRHADPFELDEQ